VLFVKETRRQSS